MLWLKLHDFLIVFILFTLVWYQVASHHRSFGSCKRCQCLSYGYMDKHGARRGKEKKTEGISRLSDYDAGNNSDYIFASSIYRFVRISVGKTWVWYFFEGSCRKTTCKHHFSQKIHKNNKVNLYMSHVLASLRASQWDPAPVQVS